MTCGNRSQHCQAQNRFAGRTDAPVWGCSRYGGANGNASLLFDSSGLALLLGQRLRLVVAVVEAVGLVRGRRAVAARRIGQVGAPRLVQESRPFGGLFPGERVREPGPQSTIIA